MNIVKIGKFTFILSPSLNIKIFPFFNPHQTCKTRIITEYVSSNYLVIHLIQEHNITCYSGTQDKTGRR